MSTWIKLAVVFAADSIVDLDLQDLRYELCQYRELAYIGLYNRGTHLSVYIQTAAKNMRMTPAKVLRICKQFGALEEIPKTYKQREGELVSQIGLFKTPGRHKGSRWV